MKPLHFLKDQPPYMNLFVNLKLSYSTIRSYLLPILLFQAPRALSGT